MKINLRNLLLILSLSILPIIFLIIGFYLKKEIVSYSLTCVDPEFCYLFNGLNLANFHLPWHIDHPGTPLQIFSAIVIRIVNVFRDMPLNQDVFTYPDFYINAINYSLLGLHSIVLLICGFLIYNSSKNILSAFFFQLIPFATCSIMVILNRVMVENLFISIVIFLSTLIFLYLKSEKQIETKFPGKYVILFALIIAVGVATKITFFPLFIIPFILLKGYKDKIIFAILTLVFFAILIFPVYDRWVYFRDWIKDLFIHSGQYGSGDMNIVNRRIFIENIKAIIHLSKYFTISVGIIFLSLLVYHLPFMKLKVKDDNQYRGLIGLFIAIILMILLVAKQYKFFYLTPAFLLIIPGLYLMILIYSRTIFFIKRNIFIIPIFIIFIVGLYFSELKPIINNHQAGVERNKPYLATLKEANKYLDSPILIVADYFGAPFKGYSIFFGTAWCGEKMRKKYEKDLLSLYPYIYNYHGWNNSFNYWNTAFTFHDLLSKYQKLFLFSGDINLENRLTSKLQGINRQLDTNFKLAYLNEQTNEKIYEVTYDSVLENAKQQYFWDSELLDTSKLFFQNKEGLLIGNGITQSSKVSMSGKFSSQLNTTAPYGMTATLSELKTADHYKISVWKLNNENKMATLVVAASDTKFYYNQNPLLIETKGDWQKIQIDLVVPDGVNNQDFKIYCWNPDEKIPAYFDDLLIEEY